MDAKNVKISPSANPKGIESAENVEQALVLLSEIVDQGGGGGGSETDPIWSSEKANYYTKAQVDGLLSAQAASYQLKIDDLQDQIDSLVSPTLTLDVNHELGKIYLLNNGVEISNVTYIYP